MSTSDLYAHLAEIIADIDRGIVRSRNREPLLEIVEGWQRTHDARAKVISKARQDRSTRIRKAVAEAAQRTMSERSGLSPREAVGIVRRRAWATLKQSSPDARCPCVRTVKVELQPYFQKTETFRATYSCATVYASSTSTHATT